MKYLMIFSIGPVQEFIATARRSRDLWYGSWMLSELSKAAAESVIGLSLPGELVFPFPKNKNDLMENTKFTVPNKVVAVVEDDPQAVAGRVRKSIEKRLGELWEDARSRIKGGQYAKDIADQQIRDLTEFSWVAVPYEDSSDEKYVEARNQAEALLSARKATRNFSQPDWSSNAPKSSLDGARESVIPSSEYPERGNPNDEALKRRNDAKIENLYIRYHARRGEQLSGVDLLKRLGDPKNSPKFKSTSDMAAIPFIQKLDKEGKKGQELLKKIESLLPDNKDNLERAEEGLVFENRLKDGFPLQEVPADKREQFNKLMTGLPIPNPYYALLAADGDFMGKVIDGQSSKTKHQEISGSLAEFAIDAVEIVEKYTGVPIYSGGDDVLAYLPLNTALDCAFELESVFREKMNAYSVVEDGMTITPTLSVGVVIVHHIEPLANALDLARKAEKDAKGVKGKNGLAVILSKRGGADRSIVGKFKQIYERLDELRRLFDGEMISGGVAYELQDMHRVLFKTNVPVASEALRVISRKREAGSDKSIEPHVREKFRHWLDTEKLPLDELAREMIVAKALAGKEEAK